MSEVPSQVSPLSVAITIDTGDKGFCGQSAERR